MRLHSQKTKEIKHKLKIFKSTSGNIIYKIRARFSARSKSYFLFAMPLDFYKLNQK